MDNSPSSTAAAMKRLLLTTMAVIISLKIVAPLSLVQGFSSSSLSFLSTTHGKKQDVQQRSPFSSLTASIDLNGKTVTASPSPERNNKSSKNIPEIRLNVFEKARTVTSVCTSGTMCTLSSHDGINGAPFGSFVDYVLDDDGNPVFLFNDMSMHTVNIQNANAAAAAAATGEDDSESSPAPATMVTLFTQLSSGGIAGAGTSQDVSRCSLTGTIVKMDSDDPDLDLIRMKYSLTHAYADQVMDSSRFSFYRLLPQRIYFVGGFGVSSKWVDIDAYQNASSDILAVEAPAIVERLNREHGEDLSYTAQYVLDLPNAKKIQVTNVDRLGMDLRVTCPLGSRRNKLQTDEFRIGFRIPVLSVEDAKSEILKVFQEAWEKGNDISWGDDDEDDDNSCDVPIMKIATDSLE